MAADRVPLESPKSWQLCGVSVTNPHQASQPGDATWSEIGIYRAGYYEYITMCVLVCRYRV